MGEKPCNQCGAVKPFTEFRKASSNKSGISGNCKPCARKLDKIYKARRDPEKVKATRSAWIKRKRAERRAYQQEWRRKNKEKYKAHNRVYTLVRNGTLVRPNECEYCGAKDVRIEAAHGDYSKPEKVIWLCVPCHRKIDDNPVAMGRLTRPEQQRDV